MKQCYCCCANKKCTGRHDRCCESCDVPRVLTGAWRHRALPLPVPLWWPSQTLTWLHSASSLPSPWDLPGTWTIQTETVVLCWTYSHFLLSHVPFIYIPLNRFCTFVRFCTFFNFYVVFGTGFLTIKTIIHDRFSFSNSSLIMLNIKPCLIVNFS